MKAERLVMLLDSIPCDAEVFFEIPDSGFGAEGDQIGAGIFEYNAVTNEVVLKYDAPCWHDEY